MANTNAPYGFRLWTRLMPGTGSVAIAPGINPNVSKDTAAGQGVLQFPSTAVLAVGDPIKSSLGIGYLATGTNAIYGVLASPVPMTFGETAKQKHYPDIIPADDQTVWRVQSTTTLNVTQGYMGVAKGKFGIGGTTSGFTGINLSTTGALKIIALAPGSSFGTYAELLVIVTRGVFYGAA